MNVERQIRNAIRSVAGPIVAGSVRRSEGLVQISRGSEGGIKGDPSRAVMLLEQAVGIEPSNAEYRAELGWCLAEDGRVAEGIDQVENAIGLNPQRAYYHYLLGCLYQSVEQASIAWHPYIGLRAEQAGNLDDAFAAFSHAARLKPRRVKYLRAAAECAARRRDWPQAIKFLEAAIEVQDHMASWHYELSRYRESAFDLAGAAASLRSAVARDPLNDAYRAALARLTCKRADWSVSRRAAAGTQSDLAEKRLRRVLSNRSPQIAALEVIESVLHEKIEPSEERLREALANVGPAATVKSVDYWMVVHWRLLARGWITLAYAVKDVAATVALQNFWVKDVPRLGDGVGAVRALVTLGRRAEARALSERLVNDARTQAAEAALGKLLADIDLIEGDPQRIQEWHKKWRVQHPMLLAARERARDLLAGKVVAIVGPAKVNDCNGEAIDLADTIVRSNYVARRPRDHPQPESYGSRTDVVYFNSGFTQAGERELVEGLEKGGVRQIVLRRPISAGRLVRHLEGGGIRLTEVEPAVHFRASSFGMQRIAYDLLLYAPSALQVHGVDFFTGKSEYRDGYKREGVDVSFRGFSHDFRGDFRFSKSLMRNELVHFDSTATHLLKLTESSYLKLLDAKDTQQSAHASGGS